MSRAGRIARRSFLVGSVAIAGGAAFGAWFIGREAPNPLRPGAGEAALGPFVLVTREGVTLITPRAEMGQGTQTTLAALIAEELDLAWQEVRIDHGPAARAYYNAALLAEGLPGKGYDRSDAMHALGEWLGQAGKIFDLQVTGGSTAMRDAYVKYRLAGAAAREALKAAAARRLGVDAATLSTEAGRVIAPDGTAIPYGELAEAAAAERLRAPDLRPASEWRLLGRALPRLDMPAKSTGRAVFSLDVRPEGLKFAAIRANPMRAGMVSFDPAPALALPGVERVVDLGDAVAVVASNTWFAMQGAEALAVEWEGAPYPPDTGSILARIEAAFESDPNSTLRDDGDAAALPAGATEVAADYAVPYLAHAAMEPLNATALLQGDRLTIWTGTQGPMFAKKVGAAETGLAPENVDVVTTLMGGAFGRRGEVDFPRYAARLAAAMPGTPVQLVWSRSEDMRQDFYRPAALARMRGAVADGRAVMLDAQVATQSAAQQGMKRWTGLAMGGPDKGAVDALFNAPYRIANHRVRGYLADLAVPVGFWRSVGASHNAFFQECFMDELAAAAGRDPIDFRLAHMEDEFPEGAAVLRAVRELSGWDAPKAPGTGRGVAFCYSFGTSVAMVVEVREAGGRIRLDRVAIACDPGPALDPGIIEAQMVGGAIYGLSAALDEAITFAGGAAEQENFPDYDALRMSGTPAFAVRILSAQPHVGGVGEPGTPPAAPALANALFDLTGQRARRLPLRPDFPTLT